MELVIKGKSYTLPAFLPDATHASIKGVDSVELQNTAIKGVVTNTCHLITDNAIDTINNAGGLKSFMNYNGLVVTDSGGFQAMSLIRRNKIKGRLDDEGVTFKNPKSGDVVHLTPETCIETQLKLGSDIIMLLDDCTDPRESHIEQTTSVKRTIAWAKRCKSTFNELTTGVSVTERPLIFGIVQGGNSKELRKACAEGLLEVGFDGYAYGGWPLDDNGLIREILEYTVELMPKDKPKYAMGIGKPADIIEGYKMGYNMFDCVIPTRDARHGRFYVLRGSWINEINIGNEIYKNDFVALDSECECYSCQNFSRAYLRHLFKFEPITFAGLASIHNLFTFQRLVENFKN